MLTIFIAEHSQHTPTTKHLIKNAQITVLFCTVITVIRVTSEVTSHKLTMESCIVLWLFISFTGVILVSGEGFYVHPNNDSSLCPDGNVSCHSLYEYIADPAGWTNDSVYYFLSGTHQLNVSVYVSSKRNVTFQGLGEMTEGPHVNVMELPVIIQCVHDDVAITFRTCNTVMLSNMTIKRCGLALQFYSLINLTLNFMSLQESSSAALNIGNVINSTLYYSSFYKNDGSRFIFRNSIGDLHNYSLADVNFSSVMVNQCNFTYEQSSAICLDLAQDYALVDIQLFSVQLFANEASGIELYSTTSLYNLNMSDLESIGGQGSGLNLIHHSNSDIHKPFIHVSDSVVSQSSLVAVSIGWFGSTIGIFHFNSTIIQNNTGSVSFGSALQIITDQVLRDNLIIVLHNATFNNHSVIPDKYGEFSSVAITVGILNVRNCTISNCTFSNNKGSGLGLVNAIATFHGHNNFTNNMAYSGGGINMASGSYLYLSTDANLSFINNHAITTGGAINIDQTVLYFTSDNGIINCFYQFVDQIMNKHFYFDNNTAETAGSVIYGGGVGLKCILEELHEINFLDISTFANTQSGYSLVSSGPRGVCFCTDTVPDCNLYSITLSAFPGGSINFSVAVSGQYNNLTTGVFRVYTNNSKGQLHNVSTAVCTNVSHIVELENRLHNPVIVNVTLNSFESNFEQPPKTVLVEIEPCPIGFCLSDKLICGCDLIPLSFTSCNVTNGSLSKENNFWVEGLNTCTVSYSSNCPFDYCIESTSFKFSLDNSDEQCNYNRTGKLCGMCSDTMSLMLGSNKCGNCTNGYLALVIPFSLAGIVLVTLIIVLNLTVTVGTINGLLFFANVIKIYQPLITGFDTIPVLSQFISWINMDFGIETCFYDGMESCGKTGLQFVFPVYLFMLIMLIIALSRWFPKFARLLGNNAVPVLCTLLLLSFTKLLRTVLSIFLYSHLFECYGDACNKSSTPRWFIDGNYEYFKGCHLALFIIALPVLIFIFVPYVSFLLFFPLWELCRSKWNKGTTLYLKLKPFFDAYAGPHTEVFRFWPGILLVTRVFLALTVAINFDKTILLSVLIAVVVILITILSSGVVYKELKLQILDIFYLVSLLVISVYDSDGNTPGIAAVLAFSFLIFLGIVVYHVCSTQKLRSIFMKRANRHKSSDDTNDAVEDETNADQARVLRPTSSVLKWSDLREPMLEM